MKAARQRREIAPTPRVKTRATDPSYRRISLGLPFEAEVHLRVACQPQLTLSLGSVSEAWRATRRLAEGEGFEPPVEFPPQWFSRPPPSTARPSLRALGQIFTSSIAPSRQA